MRQSGLAVILVVTSVGLFRDPSVGAQELGFAGRWTLNRELSQFPREIGFDLESFTAGGAGGDRTASGGRGRRAPARVGPAGFPTRMEGEDDAKRLQQLTAEVRNPPSQLTIDETPTAVTITNDKGQPRTFHTIGKEDVLQLDGVPVGATSRREAGRLVVLYQVEQGRQLRYTYSRAADPQQLVVEVQFLEHGTGDHVRRVYQPSTATETSTSAVTPVTPVAAPSAPLPTASASNSATPDASAGRSQPLTVSPKPDAELKGLTKLGVFVEDLSPQAAACGLSRSALETAVAKGLSDAGFKVLRNSDDDTYVYINVITTSLSTGLCVSRYDAFLYTHTAAKLTYQQTPVLVQVSLLHKGGIAGGASATHGEQILRNVQEYVDQFAARVRDANK